MLRFFLNEPNGKAWGHFQEMMPRLGKKYNVAMEIICKPREEYQTDAYFELDLPVAPAVMVNEEIVVEGGDVSEAEVEACILRHLGLAEWRRGEVRTDSQKWKKLKRRYAMVEMIVFHSGNPAWVSCQKAIGVAKAMQQKFGDQIDLQIHRTDSEEAKSYTFRSSTNVLVNKEMVALDVATSQEKMEEYLDTILSA